LLYNALAEHGETRQLDTQSLVKEWHTVYPESVNTSVKPEGDSLLVDVLSDVLKLPIEVGLLLRE
jgi:hypothetical protein